MNINNFTIGLRGHDAGKTFDEMLKNCTAHKINALQFAMPKNMPEIDFDKLGYNADFSKKIYSALSERNISLPILSCYINPIDTDSEALTRQLNRFKAFLHYAKDFCAGAVATETGYVPLDTTEDERKKIYDRFIKSLNYVTDTAKECNVNIAIEPVATSAVSSPYVMKNVIDDIGLDNIKVVLDMSNLMTQDNFTRQREIMDTAFALFPDRITAIHLKDFVFENGAKKYAPLGAGMLDAAYLFGKISALSHFPAIIFDETPLALYEKSLDALENILSNVK